MLKSELDFQYPKDLIATERKPHSRVMWVENGSPRELSLSTVLNEIQPHDMLLVNNSKVLKARIFAESGLEILFIDDLGEGLWSVLCPARKWPKGQSLMLPGDVRAELVATGLPQTIRVDRSLNLDYFEKHGDWPLPPYIQEQRGERSSRPSDQEMYQPAWAEEWGSLAAPTASLHFSQQDLERVRQRGAIVESLTLHVGLGTFLPIHVENLREHKMHSEWVEIKKSIWEKVQKIKSQGGRVWALGSTVTRALESQAAGRFANGKHSYSGETDLFIRPGFDYKVVDVLMTNFHQPQSTLIAMVMAFAGQETVKDCYQWAIDHKYRLFSYGDLSVWQK